MPGPFGAANVFRLPPLTPPKPPLRPCPSVALPRVPKPDVVEDPKVEPAVGPKPLELGRGLTPKALLVSTVGAAGMVLEGNAGVAGPRLPNIPLVEAEPNVPKGEVADVDSAAKPEAANAEDDVPDFTVAVSTLDDGCGIGCALDPGNVTKGETSPAVGTC